MVPPVNRRSFVISMAGLLPAYKLLSFEQLGTVGRRSGPLRAHNETVKAYVCPPCGLPCDKLTLDKPGTCPQCGMTLIPAGGGADSPLTVAVLLYNGVQLIDIAGPWEVFGTAGLLVHTVAESEDPLILVFGERVIPDYTFQNSPKADILLIPGGGYSQAMDNPRLIQWVRTKASDVRHVMTVCTGAFIAGKAGLLAGQTATATYGMIDDLLAFPNTKVVHDQRYVDNGKIITTAGLSSGIDGALHLVSKMLGLGAAQSAALGMEYRWDPQTQFVRAALADRFLPDGLAFGKANLKGARATLISTEGNRDRWEIKILVSEPRSRREIVDLVRERIANARRDVESMIASNGRNTQPPARFSSVGLNGSELRWSFADDRGQSWSGLGVVEPASDHMGKFYVTLKIALDRAYEGPR